MKPDSTGRPAQEDVERAHLRVPGDDSHVMHRYPAPEALAGLVRWFWVPVWSLPPGQRSVQRVLQHPVSLLVVTAGYARFYGVSTGLSETVLEGDGWAVGVLCTPATGALVAGGSMAGFTDRHVDVTEVLGPAGAGLTERVRAAMRDAPLDVRSHAGALAAFEEVLRPLLPLDAEGELVNRLVALVEERPDLVRTAQLAAETGLSERALQRLVSRRLGLTPKWLIQRRRLHEAAARLRADTGSTLAETAALLGYADQAHFVRDFSRVTGTTPGRFAGEHRAARRAAEERSR
ncbi:helix-turn-helix domain-containing protein [Microlunatus capsulatus]|uniref:AraC-like DNA-binding protein n=2 Tax=Microlunatus capsulatus TaxID=99117 RepID=A0ABS4ZDN1_9ACTN|nr:helix-turn-helix domain-containing protein [Microlunatus capsulatus]MBP2419152.1 AraC-like DNA-binding protein [Microlunatus capsulatus]